MASDEPREGLRPLLFLLGRMKQCTKCGAEKPLTEFKKRYDYPDKHLSWCNDCERIRKRDSARKKFKDPATRAATTLRQRLWSYGLTPEEYNKMLTESGGRCAICGESFEDTPRIDHCHTTGKVRGLLCHNCNVGLGHFKDSTENLLKAVEYLNARN